MSEIISPLPVVADEREFPRDTRFLLILVSSAIALCVDFATYVLNPAIERREHF